MTTYLEILKVIPQQVEWTVIVILVLSTVFAKTSSGIFEHLQKMVRVIVRLPLDLLALILNFRLISKNKEPLQYYHSDDVFYVGDGKFDRVQHLIEDPSYDDSMPLGGGEELGEKKKPIYLPKDLLFLEKGFAQRKKEKRN